MILNLKKSIKIILYILGSFLSVIGLLSLIVLGNLFNNDKNIGENYMLLLSKEFRQTAYFTIQKNYNQEFNMNKNFGEFCYRFFGNEIADKKIGVSLADQKIMGTVYANNNIYGAEVDPATLQLEMGPKLAGYDLKWYNWLGFGLDKLGQ
jgi:hypothetical protein